MEPSLNAPRMNLEQPSTLQLPSPENSPIVGHEGGIEREPQRFEQMPPQQQVQPQQGTTPRPVLPEPVVSQPDPSSSATLLTDVPNVAAEDDLIEKEWVNKAKTIILQTTDDPRRREEAVSQLQREYLRKRYGKELGASE